MAAQAAAAMGLSHVLQMSPQAVIRLAFSFRWPVINPAILRGGHTLGALTGGLILACAAATLAVCRISRLGKASSRATPFLTKPSCSQTNTPTGKRGNLRLPMRATR